MRKSTRTFSNWNLKAHSEVCCENAPFSFNLKLNFSHRELIVLILHSAPHNSSLASLASLILHESFQNPGSELTECQHSIHLQKPSWKPPRGNQSWKISFSEQDLLTRWNDLLTNGTGRTYLFNERSRTNVEPNASIWKLAWARWTACQGEKTSHCGWWLLHCTVHKQQMW